MIAKDGSRVPPCSDGRMEVAEWLSYLTWTDSGGTNEDGCGLDSTARPIWSPSAARASLQILPRL